MINAEMFYDVAKILDADIELIKHLIEHIDERFNILSNDWKGEAQKAFIESWGKKLSCYTALNSNMKNFAKFLREYANSMEELEINFPEDISFLQGLNVNNVDELDIWNRWNSSKSYKSLSVPIGLKTNGELFYLDLFGYGSWHGIFVGMPGSGMLDGLSAFILSMAVNFSPEDVNFVFINLTGNGIDISYPLKNLPHVAEILNDANIYHITRFLKSLNCEVRRRQKIFENATFLTMKNINAYQEYTKTNGLPEDFEPLPHIIIVIDEIVKLLSLCPDFFADINFSLLGRGMGIHFIYAVQSPKGVIRGQLAASLNFRVCFRTATSEESKEILGTNDAFKISIPGGAIIKYEGYSECEKIQTFYTKGYINNTRPFLTERDAVVKKIIDTAKEHNIPKAKKIWCEPLPVIFSLNPLIKDKKSFINGKWTQKNDGLAITVGLVDDPETQSQYPFVLDFVKDGHQVLYGAPLSGKTEFLKTLIISMVLTYTPEQVNFVLIDCVPWGMFEEFPHCIGIVDPADKENITRLKDCLYKIMDLRKNLLKAEDVGTLEAYKEITGKSLPIILIIVDNIASLNAESPEFMDVLIRLSREGSGYGIYLMLTSYIMGSFMMRISQCIKSKHALQMIDKYDYRLILGKSGRVDPPAKFPGRGLTTSKGLEFQTAFCVDGVTEKERIKNLRELCTEIENSGKGKFANEIGQLNSNQDGMFLAISKATLKPFEFCFKNMNGCIITGTDNNKNSAVLALIAEALNNAPDTKLYIYETKTFLENLCPNAKTVHDEKGSDEIVNELANIFDSRDDESKGRIVFCIDDFGKFYMDISQESADILEVISSGGEDRGIYIYIACDKSTLVKMSIFHIKFFENLFVNGNAVVTGGNLKDYTPLNALYRNDDVSLAYNEGCIIHNNRVNIIKFAALKEPDNKNE